MKKLFFLTTLILLTASFAFAQGGAKGAGKTTTKTTTTTTTTNAASKETNASPGAKAVRIAFDKLLDGIREADVDKVMGVYQKSDKILLFNNNGSATIGWEQDKSNREARYPKTTNVKLDVTGVRVELLGKDAAYITCKWKQTQDYSGTTESASGRMTLVLKLIGKDWKIVHLHTSPDNPAATRPVFPSERTTEN